MAMASVQDHEITQYSLEDASKFDFRVGENAVAPSHLQEKLVSTASKMLPMKGFTNFANFGKEGEFHVASLYSNQCLGGGVTKEKLGLAQEEIKNIEIPDLLMLGTNPDNFNAKTGKSTIYVRKPYDNESASVVGTGRPEPLLFTGLKRVLDIGLYGPAWLAETAESVKNSAKVKSLSEAQTINMIALAAPDLTKTPEFAAESDRTVKATKCRAESTKLNTLIDLTNTLTAAILLTKKVAGKLEQKPVFHSGKVGCGVFGNDPAAVYLMLSLLSAHHDIEIVAWDYGDKEQVIYEDLKKQLFSSEKLKDASIENCLEVIGEIVEKSEPTLTPLYAHLADFRKQKPELEVQVDAIIADIKAKQ